MVPDPVTYSSHQKHRHVSVMAQVHGNQKSDSLGAYLCITWPALHRQDQLLFFPGGEGF